MSDTRRVHFRGQIIGAVLADSKAHAKRAASVVQVTYEDCEDEKPIITIEQAIEAQSFLQPDARRSMGDVDKAFKHVDGVLEGEVRLGGQEHFYMETQCCLVVPKDGDEIEVFSSSQYPMGNQVTIANTLGIPCNRVSVRVKRIGGGFGGKSKQDQILLLVVAVAAKKVNRPVRCMLDRDDDNLTTGKRSPFLGRYQVGFMEDGKIAALDLKLFSNAGNSTDYSTVIIENAVNQCLSAYAIPNVRAYGVACRTNLNSATALRAIGVPQASFACETIITDVAKHLGLRTEKVRQLNLYKTGDMLLVNQVLNECTLDRCWEECIAKSEFQRRRAEADIFNSENRWKKKGIAVVPTMYGIGIPMVFMQTGALVHVYTDGSVLLTHGGVEMGQGLHTKMIQVASRVLKIPTSRIHTSETSTNTVPNTTFTAGSLGSDLNGIAVMEACQTIIRRLEPFVKANPDGTWNDWVEAAYFDRVSLSATGFYRVPDDGRRYIYHTCGVACSEVEIDCLTGEHQLLRTDIVMDVGRSLNPAIDVGQIEGAFMQGYGLFVLEKLNISNEGVNLSHTASSYQIPKVKDIPRAFNVSLLKESGNPRAVYSSKAVGEPPLFLASSVFFAIKNAIITCRADAGLQQNFRLDSPATPDKILMACVAQGLTTARP